MRAFKHPPSVLNEGKIGLYEAHRIYFICDDTCKLNLVLNPIGRLS